MWFFLLILLQVLQQEGGALEEKVTPSKFLNPNKRFNPGFNIEVSYKGGEFCLPNYILVEKLDNFHEAMKLIDKDEQKKKSKCKSKYWNSFAKLYLKDHSMSQF